MALHPVIAEMYDRLAASGRPALSAGTPDDARRVVAEARPLLGRGPDLDHVVAVTIPTRSGSIPGRLFSGPVRARSPVQARGSVRVRGSVQPVGLLVYLHGGGWVLGGLDDFDAFARVLADRSGCAVLLVDYRVAWEAWFPAAVEDAIDAVRWAHDSMRQLVGGTVPLLVGGDSAGGNLATIAAAELCGTVPLALQLLIYPVTDGDLETASYRSPQVAGALTREDMAWFFGLYAPGVPRTERLLHPMARPDLSGLPAAHVVIAEYDVLRDDGEGYARRLSEAGVATTLRRYDGLPHGFIRLHNLVDAVDAALTDMAMVVAEACREAAPKDSEDGREAAPEDSHVRGSA